MTDYSSVKEQLQQEIAAIMDEFNIPGLAIALIDRDQLVWAEGFGHTDISKSTAVQPVTIFSVQSISKTYTALAFLRAVDKGLIGLDDSLVKYLPGFSVKSRFGPEEIGKITFRHLLSHHAGFFHEAPVGNNFGIWHNSFADHIRSIEGTWLLYPVGQRWSYSNLGIDLAAYVLQEITGKRFEDYVAEEVFAPLGMNSSTFDQQQALADNNRARGHANNREIAARIIPMIPSGGMYSNVLEMAQFVMAQLTGETASGDKLLSEGLHAEMLTPQFSGQVSQSGYCLGVEVSKDYGTELAFHGGGGYGYITFQGWLPKYQLGVVMLTNSHATSSGVKGEKLPYRALELMMQKKLGHVPSGTYQPFQGHQEVSVPESQLQKLAGTYLIRGGLFSFFADGDKLLLKKSPDAEPEELKAFGDTMFATEDSRLDFVMEGDCAKGVKHTTKCGHFYFPLNDRPHEQQGPAEPDWQSYTGSYSTDFYTEKATINVHLKNGHLYLDKLKLHENQPGLFFTANGFEVRFEKEVCHYAGVKFSSDDKDDVQ